LTDYIMNAAIKKITTMHHIRSSSMFEFGEGPNTDHNGNSSKLVPSSPKYLVSSSSASTQTRGFFFLDFIWAASDSDKERIWISCLGWMQVLFGVLWVIFNLTIVPMEQAMPEHFIISGIWTGVIMITTGALGLGIGGARRTHKGVLTAFLMMSTLMLIFIWHLTYLTLFTLE